MHSVPARVLLAFDVRNTGLYAVHSVSKDEHDDGSLIAYSAGLHASPIVRTILGHKIKSHFLPAKEMKDQKFASALPFGLRTMAYISVLSFFDFFYFNWLLS